MNIHVQIDKENDQLYLSFERPELLSEATVARTIEVNDDIHVDLDENGHLVGLDIANASKILVDDHLSQVSIDELVGVKEAAAILGVRKPNFVRDHASREDFPKPVAELSSGRIWLRSSVEDYVNRREQQHTKQTESSSAEGTTLESVLLMISAQDEIAFRYLALDHFDRSFMTEAKAAPSLADVALASFREDEDWLTSIETGSEERYFSAAERIFRKYYRTSKSYLRSLLHQDDRDRTDQLFKSIWADAFRRLQLDRRQVSEIGSFTQWLRALILETLRTYQFEISAEALLDVADPIHAPVLLGELEKAKHNYEVNKDRQRDANRLMLKYLESMSEDELLVYFQGRRSKERISVAREELVTQLRRGYLDQAGR